MRYKLDCISWNSEHVKFNLFDRQGANCGVITVATRDVFYFLQAAWKGEIVWNDRMPDDASENPEKYGAAPQKFGR